MQSTIAWDLPQADGRRVVRESHVVSEIETRFIDYIVPAGYDVEQRLQQNAASIQAEIDALENPPE